MRSRRVGIPALSAVGLIAGATFTAAPGAQAAGGVTIYVGSSLTTTHCSDTAAGAGSLTTPFCTIQAAVGIVQPGDTIVISGNGQTSFTIATSGTAAAPITIESALPPPSPFGFQTQIVAAGAAAAITVGGAGYRNLLGLAAYASSGPAIAVTGSSHITFDYGFVESSSPTDTQPAFHVTGGSSYVTLSRSSASAAVPGGVIAVDGGGAGDVITTDYVNGSSRTAAIKVDGASNAAVTSNSVRGACGAAIQITGGTTATVENNVVNQMLSAQINKLCPTQPADTRALLVDASSATGSSADYNDFDPSFAGPGALDYSWAGTSYATPAALTAATGQGAHDASAPTVPNPAALSGFSSAAIDSADSNAPGELPTDYVGHARVDDPVVPDTGAGAHTYYDRGALEIQAATPTSSMVLSAPGGDVTMAPVGGTVTFTGTVHDPWDGKLTCTIDFGDGTSAQVAAAATTGMTAGTCSTTHQYTATGWHTPTLSNSYSDGSTRKFSTSVFVDSPTPLAPSLQLFPATSTSVFPSCNATSGWNIIGYTVNFGDGTTPQNCNTYPYRRPGTYTVTMTATDAGGNSASTSTPYTTVGNYYTPLTPSRILDTRNGTGTGSAAKVAANGVLKLKVAGIGGVPASGAAAVALNVTVTRPTAGGYVTVYPDGVARPGTSNLNFSAGQTVPNTVIAKVGADGAIDLANISAGTTDLVADVEGYYSLDGTSGYETVTPVRVLDTRVSKTTLAPGATTRVYFNSFATASAVTLNITVANAKQSGYITAYPDGVTAPTASNANFAAGQVTQNEAMATVGADGYVDFTNGSSGSTDLIVDQTGYFTTGGGLAFMPITPIRLADTRRGTGVPLGPVAAGATLPVPAGQNIAVPAGFADAVAANVTVTAPTASGYVTVFPDAQPRPLTSILNFTPGQTIPNATTVGVGPDNYRDIDLYNGSAGTVQLVVDAVGFYN